MHLSDGELVGLIGPNGAGKSTLLKVLAGLQSSDSGEVFWQGQSLHSTPPVERARAMAYLPQQEVPAWPLTVESLVGLGRSPWHRPMGGYRQEDIEAVKEALDPAGRFPEY